VWGKTATRGEVREGSYKESRKGGSEEAGGKVSEWEFNTKTRRAGTRSAPYPALPKIELV